MPFNTKELCEMYDDDEDDNQIVKDCNGAILQDAIV